MASLFPTKFDVPAGLILNVISAPVIKGDVAFDSYLLRHNDGSSNHTLTLVLKINLQQAEMFGLRAFPVLDWNKTLFVMRPWPAAKWSGFKQRFLNQCLLWNDRFWLIPPAGFSKLDVKVGSRTLRPNIYCHLYVALQGGPGGAHRTITVVHLDKKDEKSFRSDASHYNSGDVDVEKHEWTDDRGHHHRVNNFSTVAHEIGHALGLHHAGVEHKDPFCSVAVALETAVPGGVTAGFLKGGSASDACYGDFAPVASGANVMGQGRSFDESDARPWKERLGVHIGADTAGWTVSRRKQPPVLLT